MPETSLEGLIKELRMVANKKKTTNKGNPNPEDLFLKNQADPMTKGIIQNVLVTFKVAATSIASSPSLMLHLLLKQYHELLTHPKRQILAQKD